LRPAPGEAQNRAVPRIRQARWPWARRCEGVAFALAGAGLLGCWPGLRVEVYNHTDDEAAVTASYNDGSSATRRLPPGDSLVSGSALVWYVRAGGVRSELLHPGDAFRAAGWLGGEFYRFQIEPPGCVYALAPGQERPAASFAPQPPGYPVGPPGRCVGG
jgi:hypothetical protein